MENINVRSHSRPRVFLVVVLAIVVLLIGGGAASVFLGNNKAGEVLTYTLSEPLGEVTTAKIDINRYSGNLDVAMLSSGEQVLASGTLAYLDTQDLARTVETTNGEASLSLSTSPTSQSGFSFPWVGCADDTLWQVYLNPGVLSDITAHSGGGNIRLNLAGLSISHVKAETGGGNLEVILPANPSNLVVIAKTGAGNVSVKVPDGVAARIHATTGLGKVDVDARFSKMDESTYQSPGYDSAANRVEITVDSGAGNAIVN